MLLDTSGLLALIDAREPLHKQAIEAYANASRRVTHSFILAELVALSNARGLPIRTVLSFLISLITNPDIEAIWPDKFLTSQAISLLIGRQGSGYSLADAVSFVVMRNHGIVDALSTDRHCEDEGYRVLLK